MVDKVILRKATVKVFVGMVVIIGIIALVVFGAIVTLKYPFPIITSTLLTVFVCSLIHEYRKMKRAKTIVKDAYKPIHPNCRSSIKPKRTRVH